ncbi:elongation of very long chain fatty acids protein 1 [Trichonephila clavipes]|nr:elongation of very long chain fatty acids protein 1 [Trichonephila clavipes]
MYAKYENTLNTYELTSDPRLMKYPLMKNVKIVAFCSVVYLLFVKVVGPAWMKNRNPFGLRKVMIFYNLFLVAVNAWITYNLLAYGWLNKYSWLCEPIDTSEDPIAMQVVFALWIFGMSKLIDYFDTGIEINHHRSEVQIPGWARSTQPFIPAVGRQISTKLAWELNTGVSMSDRPFDRNNCTCTPAPEVT